MMTLAQAARWLDLAPPAIEVNITGISTDSRSVKAGELFVALTGDRFDGHEFLAQVQEQGAVAALVSRQVDGVLLPQLVVKDTRLGLGCLAAGWRAGFKGMVVGLTGSNGKTTVKEMIASILSQTGFVLATQGNLNNDIGVPMTLFRLNPGVHRSAVIEMGANHLGEIAYLTGLVRPDIALVNNAGTAHIGEFGGLENVARGKGEIWQGLSPNGVAVINADDDFANYWRGLVKGRRIVTFGARQADVSVATEKGWLIDGGRIQNRFVIKTPQGEVEVALHLAGHHNVLNALAATASALAAGATLAHVKAGLESMQPVKGRLQPQLSRWHQLVIDDTYNANPSSAAAAIDVLVQLARQTIFVLGDMGELGTESPQLHHLVGEHARQRGVSRFYATGTYSQEAVRAFAGDGFWFETQTALIDALVKDLKQAGSEVAVLVKGSRSARMENVVAALMAEKVTAQGGGGSGVSAARTVRGV
jgi:UDP-N-acetylmuramoyl-tripeptide--D-alanyl-D-alanine ligase